MVPKLLRNPPLVWDPHLCPGRVPRLEADLRLTRLVPALPLTCCVILAKLLTISDPQFHRGRRSLNLVGSKHLPSLTLDTSTFHAQRAHWRAVGFPYHSSREPLRKGFCSQISWKDAASQHPCPGTLQATLAH